MEPTLPIHPTLVPGLLNPCIEAGQPKCLPYVHVVSGWHMFSEEALGWLKKLKAVDMRSGLGCFDDWGEGDEGAAKWVSSFGTPPTTDTVIISHCNKLLTWYPAFAGRYTSAWGKAYGPCKTKEMAALPKGVDYYATKMWQVCRPAALAAHDKAMGTGGPGKEATPPFVMRSLYGPRVRVISALRSPVDRLETSFWGHRHYPIHYEKTGGLRKYISEQGGAFNDCAATHGARRCAHLFELLGQKYADVFFHCDQIIRGLYEPFIQDWFAAFGHEGFLAIRVESLLDDPLRARTQVLGFLGLPSAPAASAATLAPLAPLPNATGATGTRGTYKALHCGSLRAAKAPPMDNATRAAVEAFYRPYNTKLEKLLGWAPGEAWGTPTACTATEIAAATPQPIRRMMRDDSPVPGMGLSLRMGASARRERRRG